MKAKTCLKPDFLMIPIQLYDDPSIEPMDRDVYGVVYWYEHLKDGECRASNESIACVISGASVRAIQNSLTKLEEMGYIEREYKDEAKRNRLRIRTKIAFKYSSKGECSVGDRQKTNEVLVIDECSVGDRASAVLVTRDSNRIKNRNKSIEKTPSQKAKEFFQESGVREEMKNIIVGKIQLANPAATIADIEKRVAVEIGSFVSYWTEPNKSGTKQKWEMEPTFEIERRIGTWLRNSQRFGHSKTPQMKKGLTV